LIVDETGRSPLGSGGRLLIVFVFFCATHLLISLRQQESLQLTRTPYPYLSYISICNPLICFFFVIFPLAAIINVMCVLPIHHW